MRSLSIEELDYVAGGYSSEEPITEVTVTAPRKNPNTLYANEVTMPRPVDNPYQPIQYYQWVGPTVAAAKDILLGIIGSILYDAGKEVFGKEDELAQRDANTNFDRTGKIEETYLDKNGKAHTGYWDPADKSFWVDANGDGRYETHTKLLGDTVWLDTNNDGGFDKPIWNNSTQSAPRT